MGLDKDELAKLSPEERIHKLKGMEEDAKKELEEAEESINVPFTTIEKRIERNVKQPTAMDPFVSVAKGFGELFVPSFLKGDGKKKKPKVSAALMDYENFVAKRNIKQNTYYLYHETKKHCGMLWW